MCNLSIGLVKKGEIRGEIRGEKKGENKLGDLIAKLLSAGRTDDAQLAATNEEARKRFYREFGIID